MNAAAEDKKIRRIVEDLGIRGFVRPGPINWKVKIKLWAYSNGLTLIFITMLFFVAYGLLVAYGEGWLGND